MDAKRSENLRKSAFELGERHGLLAGDVDDCDESKPEWWQHSFLDGFKRGEMLRKQRENCKKNK